MVGAHHVNRPQQRVLQGSMVLTRTGLEDRKVNLVGSWKEGNLATIDVLDVCISYLIQFHFEEKYSAVCYVLWACWNMPLCLL